jgi:hypothetical protein
MRDRPGWSFPCSPSSAGGLAYRDHAGRRACRRCSVPTRHTAVQRPGTLSRLHDLSQCDLVCRASEGESTAAAFGAGQDLRVHQLLKDLGQKSPRQAGTRLPTRPLASRCLHGGWPTPQGRRIAYSVELLNIMQWARRAVRANSHRTIVSDIVRRTPYPSGTATQSKARLVQTNRSASR